MAWYTSSLAVEVRELKGPVLPEVTGDWTGGSANLLICRNECAGPSEVVYLKSETLPYGRDCVQSHRSDIVTAPKFVCNDL